MEDCYMCTSDGYKLNEDGYILCEHHYKEVEGLRKENK